MLIDISILFRSYNEAKFKTMYTDIQGLVNKVCKGVVLPPLISYKHYKQQVSAPDGKRVVYQGRSPDCKRSAHDWYCEMFKALVRCPETRCAALDILCIWPEDIMMGCGVQDNFHVEEEGE